MLMLVCPLYIHQPQTILPLGTIHVIHKDSGDAGEQLKMVQGLSCLTQIPTPQAHMQPWEKLWTVPQVRPGRRLLPL